MNSATHQLALSLPHSPQMTRADFLTGAANEAAATLIDRFPQWPNHVVLLVGPAGSGKTHLARIWKEASAAAEIEASTLHEVDIDRLLATGRVLVEGLDRGGVDEAALFHLINRVRERSAFLLITSREAPSSLGLKLPDLASRLRAVLPVELSAPDDDLLQRVLVKLFSDRQLGIDPSLVPYISRRMERSFDAANRLVAALDEAALAAGRPITRQLASQILDRDFGLEPELPL
ncbi:hypothetical protein C3941_07515 [Kaistia algarum]|uniref:DnaA/Hda family protein n=1 Tax=Kaistia algarum TaxID=2083279 RepID=UPI000CE83E75|nr:DnaA/Hda family protein [Kaistia algarum]MCX5511905.1 DnaA/Hda family protein [Kaistia algarum]PPE80039.1 hypothetical protein C3941_07515 [Kaistia algarum]